jgi:hypothetical protein
MRKRMNRRGAMNWAGVAILVVIFLALALILVQAEGAPSTPGVALSGSLNPSVAQTIQVTFTNTMYAAQPVNSVLNFGTAIIYTIIANNITTIAFNQKVATSPISSSGALYTMQATVSLAIPQLCSGSACVGFTENLTVKAYATASTWVGFWQSSTVTASFLSSGTTTPAPTQPGSAPIAEFYYETLGMVTLFAAFALFVIGAFGIRPTETLVAGGVLVVAFVLEVLVLVVR